MSTGTYFYLKVRSIDDQTEHQISFDKAEFDKVKNLCEDRTNMANFLKASLMPIRTDWDSFSKDFFLPNFVNLALTVQGAVASFFLSLLCIAWDLVTLPCRIITCIPRFLYHLSVEQKAHPLSLYLKEHGFPKNLLEGMVKIQLLKKYTKPGALSKIQCTKGFQYEIPLLEKETPINFTTAGTIKETSGDGSTTKSSQSHSTCFFWN